MKKNKLLIYPSEAREDIQNILDKIVKVITNNSISECFDCLLLSGGFGRGEGSVIKENGVFSPTNDFDLFAICSIIPDDKKLMDLINFIEKELNLRFFDISIIHCSVFKKIKKKPIVTQSFFDFIFGSEILWINPIRQNIFALLNNYALFKEDIKVSKESAFSVLRTRLWCLIAMTNFNMAEPFYDVNSSFGYNFFCYQIIKAASAVMDAILIIEGCYKSPKYEDKIIIFKTTSFYKKYVPDVIIDLMQIKLYNKENVQEHIDISIYNAIISLYVCAYKYITRKCKPDYMVFTIFEQLQYCRNFLRGKKKQYPPYRLKNILLLKDIQRYRCRICILKKKMIALYSPK
jgi:hypothetical protein